MVCSVILIKPPADDFRHPIVGPTANRIPTHGAARRRVGSICDRPDLLYSDRLLRSGFSIPKQSLCQNREGRATNLPSTHHPGLGWLEAWSPETPTKEGQGCGDPGTIHRPLVAQRLPYRLRCGQGGQVRLRLWHVAGSCRKRRGKVEWDQDEGSVEYDIRAFSAVSLRRLLSTR